MKLLLVLAMSLFLVNCSSTSKNSGSTRTPDNVGFNSNGCPKNYVKVPALEGYTNNDFCVMKYEAKNDGSGNAISQASGKPYVNINRSGAKSKCTRRFTEGYDLISNDEWQSIARNIELVPSNWSTGVVGNAGGLSRGHSDRVPPNALAASSDDTKGCEGTGQTCSNTVWDSQRRTHTLSNGEVIWDISGNVMEWVRDRKDPRDDSKYNSTSNANAFISQVTATSHPGSDSLSGGLLPENRNAKTQFGPSGDYVSLSTQPYGGLGYGLFNSISSGVFRGGGWSDGTFAGVFTLYNDTPGRFGFRCVFRP